MKPYTKTFATFWTGATAKRLAGHGPHVKLLASYLTSSPAALAADNYGVFYIERDVMQRHLECDPHTLDMCAELLAKYQFAYWDRETEWVWVREAAAWQYGTPLLPKDYVCANARKWYQQLPQNPWLTYWFDRYVADLCLQHDADRWVDRREWDGALPAIARYVAPIKSTAVTPPPPRRNAPKTFDRERAIKRLQAIHINGAIGTAIDAAVMKLQQGDVPIEIVDRQLLDIVLEELGPQIDKGITKDLARYKSTLTTMDFDRVRRMMRDREARDILRLPELREGL